MYKGGVTKENGHREFSILVSSNVPSTLFILGTQKLSEWWMNEWMNVLVLYHTSFHSSVYINTIFYVLTIKWHFNWDVFYIRENTFLKIQSILMRNAVFIVLSHLLKLIVCLQSLLPFLFSFIFSQLGWHCLFIILLTQLFSFGFFVQDCVLFSYCLLNQIYISLLLPQGL